MKKEKILAGILSGFTLFGGMSFAYAAEPKWDDLTAYELTPIVITASRTPEKLVDATADISVVGRKEIEALHLESVEDILRQVPGVQFLNYGVNGMNANLSGIRINGCKDIIVLVDGVRINSALGANNGGYMYASVFNNMDNIESVEVLRGGAGAAYGSGAKGGVINIRTRKVTGSQTTIDISGGDAGQENYKFNTMGRVGDQKFSYEAFYNKTLRGNITDGGGKLWPGHTDTHSGGVTFAYDFEDGHSAKISYDTITSDYNGEDYVYNNAYKGDYEDDNLTLQHHIELNDHWYNDFTYRRSNVDTAYGQIYHADGVPYSISRDMKYDNVSEQLVFTDSRNTFLVGVDWTKARNNKQYTHTEIVYDEEDDADVAISTKYYPMQKNRSIFVQESWDFLPRFNVTAGLRYDKADGDKYRNKIESHTSKSYKLSYEVTDKDTIYGGCSEYYILPGMDKLYDFQGANPALKASEGKTYTVGMTHEFDDTNAVTFNWFKTEDTSVVGWQWNSSDHSDPSNGQYVNFADGMSRGWNLQYMGGIDDHWSINAGWAHLYQNVPGDNFKMGYAPKDKLTFDIIYKNRKLTTGFNGFYFIRRVDETYKGPKGWPSDKYGVYNLSINYEPIKEVMVYAKVNNIFDKLWAEHTDVIHQPSPTPGAWYSMPGRTYVLGMKYKF